MATGIIAVLGPFLCIWTLAACKEGNIIGIKSSSANAPMLLLDEESVERRIKREKASRNLTYNERVEFLKAHNEFRANTQPTASDMQFLSAIISSTTGSWDLFAIKLAAVFDLVFFQVWHEELASMAQEWAERCRWEHGNPTRDPKPFQWIGQNILYISGYSTDMKTLTKYWHDEVKHYSYSSNACAGHKSCGHYTQVVWANTNRLGCGKTMCDPASFGMSQPVLFVVCNYGPGGNFIGQKPYTAGPKCSKCPSDKPTCSKGLCAPNPKCGKKSCENGGTLDLETCECACRAGYTGFTCKLTGRLNGPIDIGAKRKMKHSSDKARCGLNLLPIGL
ncbi:hypothetical protein LSH36_578g01083 [Paralvinella palmiformis]|uniref:EGF-like domain-containing protein n=1 Tax=Paralvinella palmiformis TaxID=53620 RepID=A0AAD9J5S0_9ANNE|nr:hypothetical protein LSH36_578g01083 [Paralvinella palmiformis]